MIHFEMGSSVDHSKALFYQTFAVQSLYTGQPQLSTQHDWELFATTSAAAMPYGTENNGLVTVVRNNCS